MSRVYVTVPDLLVARPYRARYRDVRPGDNAGRIIRDAAGWRVLERRDQIAELMATPPGRAS